MVFLNDQISFLVKRASTPVLASMDLSLCGLIKLNMPEYTQW